MAQRMVLTAEPPKSVAGRPLDPLNLAKPKPFWPMPSSLKPIHIDFDFGDAFPDRIDSGTTP